VLPLESQSVYPELFGALTTPTLQQYGALSYGICLPSLQEIFLKVVDSEGEGYTAPAVGTPLEAGSSEPGTSSSAKPPSAERPSMPLVRASAQSHAVDAVPLAFMESLRTRLWACQMVLFAEFPYVTFSLALLMMLVGFVLPSLIHTGGGSHSAPVFSAAPSQLSNVGGGGQPLPFFAADHGVAFDGLEHLASTGAFDAEWLGHPQLATASEAIRTMQRAVHTSAALDGSAVGALSPFANGSTPALSLWSSGFAMRVRSARTGHKT
jgi:hypothetical protein